MQKIEDDCLEILRRHLGEHLEKLGCNCLPHFRQRALQPIVRARGRRSRRDCDLRDRCLIGLSEPYVMLVGSKPLDDSLRKRCWIRLREVTA